MVQEQEFIKRRGGMVDIRSEIRNYILDNLMMGREIDNFSDSDSLLGKGIIDSTGVLELVGFLEENYQFTVEEDDLIPDNFDSVDKLFNYVQGKKD